MTTIPTTEGLVPFVVGDHTFSTWYKVIGDLKNSKHRPLLILHGGPGMNHIYMKPHTRLYTEAGIPVIYYDQLSLPQYPDSPPEFWTMDLYNDEIDNLLNHLGIRDDFDMLGHSWGGVLGSDYASRRPHPGLKNLIIANTFASSALYRDGTVYWRENMPDGLDEVIRKHREEKTTDSDEYMAAMKKYYQMHMCSLDPWPADLNESLSVVGKNRPPLFNMSQTLKDWTVVPTLKDITARTLLVSSPRDEMWEPAVRPFFELIPHCKWIDMQEEAVTHLPFYEAPDRYFSILSSFLEEA